MTRGYLCNGINQHGEPCDQFYSANPWAELVITPHDGIRRSHTPTAHFCESCARELAAKYTLVIDTEEPAE